MTISSTTRKAGPFIGNGSQTAFPFTFKVFVASDLVVKRVVVATGVESTLALTTDYTVALNQDQDANPGGTVTLTSALASGRNLILTSGLPVTQPTDLTNLGGFYPDVIDDALDRATIQAQQIKESVDRALRFPITDAAVSAELPPAGVRRGTLLAFDATTGAPVVGPTAASIQAYAQTYIGTRATAPSARADGSALQNGDNYFNTANTQMRVFYNGSWYAMVASVGEAASVVYTPASLINTNVQAKLRQYVSAKDYGAVGDGVADDTAALNAALAAGAPVYLPPGEYRTTGPVYLDSGAVLTGAGSASTKIIKSTNTAGTGSNTARSGTVTDSYAKNAALIVRHGNNGYAANVVLRGIELESDEDAVTGDYLVEYGVFAPRLRQTSVADVIVRNFRYGFVTHDAERLVLENVDVDCGTQRGVNGAAFGWLSETWAFWFANDGSAESAGHGVSLVGCSARNVHRAFDLYKVEGVAASGCRAEGISKFAVVTTGGGGSFVGLSVGSVLCDPSAFSFGSGGAWSLDGCIVSDPQGLASGTSRAFYADGASVTLRNTSFANFSTVGAARNAALASGSTVFSVASTLPANGAATTVAGTGVLHELDSSSWRSTSSTGVRYAVMASVNTASTVLASGQANVSGDTLVNTGVSGLAGKVIMVSTYTEDNNVPLTLAHVVGTSGTSFRVKFTNTSDGTANAGTFKINWVVVG